MAFEIKIANATRNTNAHMVTLYLREKNTFGKITLTKFYLAYSFPYLNNKRYHHYCKDCLQHN